jgi:hypothetical protein
MGKARRLFEIRQLWCSGTRGPAHDQFRSHQRHQVTKRAMQPWPLTAPTRGREPVNDKGGAHVQVAV